MASPLRPHLRLVVVGPEGVGKSCLTFQFIAGRFMEETYDPALEDSYRKQLHVDGTEFVLDIFDTAGQDEFAAIREQHYRTGDGFLLVYSIALRSSFEEIPGFESAIKKAKDMTDSVPLVIVGNKTDLENHRKVSSLEGEQLAKKLGAPFMETSAKTRVNVDEIFFTLVQEVVRLKKASDTNPEETDIRERPTGVIKKSKCIIF